MNDNHGRYLLVHGMGGAAALFEALALALGADRQCAHAVELPGHGARADEAPLSSVDELADDVAAHARSLPAGPPFVVVGHSLGGAVAQALAVRHRALVERIVLVSSALRFPAAAVLLAAFDADPAGARALFAEALGPAALVPRSRSLLAACSDAALRADIVALAGFDGRAGEGERAAALVDPAAIARARAFALVVGGDRDELTPPRAWRRLAESWGADVLAIDGGHMLPEERPAEIAAALRRG